MHRCALFVDFGYVRAALRLLGRDPTVGPHSRLDYAALAGDLATFLELDCGLPLLRSYWYDAAPARGESALIRPFASVERVKVRLGSLSETGQKEVDIQLHEDLTTVAAGGHVATLYLLSGDGDFRPTIARTQSFGAELRLVDIVGSPASQLLAAEADCHITLPSEFFQPYLEDGSASTAASVDTPSPGDPYERAAFEAGSDFARDWLVSAGLETAGQLVRQSNWRLPSRLDAELLRSADSATGLMRAQPQLRRLVRAGFWRELSARFPPITSLER